MTRRTSISLLLAGALVGSAGALAVTPPDFAVRAAQAAVTNVVAELNLFGEVFQRVRTDYVEKPDEKSMVTDAIGGMVSDLDPQSAYFTAANVARAGERPGDATETIGVLLTQDDGATKVVSVLDGTPAAAAGVLAGDLIAFVNGHDLTGANLMDVTDALNCVDAKPVPVTIVRDGVSDPFTLKLACAKPATTSVQAHAEGPVGYVRISRFTQRTPDELKSAIEKIRAEVGADKLRGYVFDLRNNPGGVFNAAVTVADDLLTDGNVVSVHARNAADDREIAAKADDLTVGKPIVVLVNSGSAAEAEIVAGALKDDHRATLVGARSFGMGSIQSVIPLGQDGALRLTTARYYTPSGGAIQAKGIDPDIVVVQKAPTPPNGAKPQTNAAAKTSGEGTPVASAAYIPQDPLKDTQLQYGLGLVRGSLINPVFPVSPKKPAAG